MSGTKKRFFKGAVILTVAGLVVKAIGAVNRIVMSRLLGGEGIGLYQMAYPVYQAAISVATAGIPIAISIMVAERLAHGDYRGVRRVFWLAFTVTALLGLGCSAGLYTLAGWLTEVGIVRDSRAYWSIAALSPAIFFVAALSAYRGLFQGLQDMRPTAVSQVIEQGIRVAVMLAMVVLLLPYGLEYGAAGASFGAVPGAIAAVGYLSFLTYKKLRRLPSGQKCSDLPTATVLARLVKLAVPVSLANLMLPITANIDLLVVPVRLEDAGYDVHIATELYGYLTGMAASLISLPTILTASLAASIVPAIAEGLAKQRFDKVHSEAREVFRLTAVAMMPCAAGLYFLAYPIASLLYGTAGAGQCIEILSLGVVVLGFGQVSTGILQGMGHTVLPFINMLAAALAKFAVGWYLTALPQWGISGAAWATNFDFLVAAGLNILCIAYYLRLDFEWGNKLKLAALALIMGLGAQAVYDYTSLFWGGSLAVGAAIGSGVLLYMLLLIVSGEAARLRQYMP